MPDPNRPNYDDVIAALDRLNTASDSSVTVTPIGTSVQGREIPVAVVTDPAVESDDKQHVLIIAGQHGTEESGRAIALELLRFLLSDDGEAAAIRRNQVVAVMPCVNPDGAMLKTYRNADDIDVAHTWSFSNPPGTPEGRALSDFADTFVPDAFVDIHGLAGGSMKERVWLPPLPAFYPDRTFSTAIGMAMTDAAENAGYPQSRLIPPRVLSELTGHAPGAGVGSVFAIRYKCLAFGLETIEQYYREPDWRRSGLIRLKVLLGYGRRDAFGLGRPGYPVNLVSGDSIYGLAAHGATAIARRANRVSLARFLQANYALVDRDADGVIGHARVTIRSDTINGENPDAFAIILTIKKPCDIKRVTWRGQPLSEDADHGFSISDQPGSVRVRIAIREPFGGPARDIDVEYDSPYLS